MNQVKLYNYFRSSTSYRVRIALNLKKIPYEYIPIHLVNNGGEQNTDNYRKINPSGGVPTLDDNGKLISQSIAIIEYLDEIKTQQPLFSKDTFIKAKIKQACEIINADSHPLHNLRVMKMLEVDFNFNEEQKDKWIKHWISTGLRAFEKTIQPFASEYCFGNVITAADVFLIPQLFSAHRFNVSLDEFKLLQKINANCVNLEAFQLAHPYRQPDTPADLKIN